MSVSLKFEVLPVKDILSSAEKVTAPCWMKLSRWFTKGMKGPVGLEVIKLGWRTRPSIHYKTVYILVLPGDKSNASTVGNKLLLFCKIQPTE